MHTWKASPSPTNQPSLVATEPIAAPERMRLPRIHEGAHCVGGRNARSESVIKMIKNGYSFVVTELIESQRSRKTGPWWILVVKDPNLRRRGPISMLRGGPTLWVAPLASVGNGRPCQWRRRRRRQPPSPSSPCVTNHPDVADGPPPVLRRSRGSAMRLCDSTRGCPLVYWS